MRFNFSGHLVMERGQHPSDGPRRIEVADAATGAVLATFPAGFNPRWFDAYHIKAESADGLGHSLLIGMFEVEYVPANRGQLDANGAGMWAVSDLHSTNVTTPAGTLRIDQARDPRLSRGHLAVRHPATGSLRIHNGAELGPATDSRWSSETLVWWHQGRVWGRIVPNQPTQELRIPGRSLSHPAPFWHAAAGRLWVALVMDDGVIALAEWGELAAGSGAGYLLGQSSGSGFDIDCAPGDEPHEIRVAYFDPLGKPVYMLVDTSEALDDMSRPPTPEPEPLPDIPWTTDPDGVVADIWPWIRDHATALSPDGRVAWILKSDEANYEGQTHGEHWSSDDTLIGHLEDSSTGYRWWPAGNRRVNADEWVALGEPEPWLNLPLERNYFNDGARLWMPRRCVSGYRQEYRTDINWLPSGEVWRDIHMEIRVDVGYGRYQGREAFVRQYYIPGGNAEENWLGPTGWVKHVPAEIK